MNRCIIGSYLLGGADGVTTDNTSFPPLLKTCPTFQIMVPLTPVPLFFSAAVQKKKNQTNFAGKVDSVNARGCFVVCTLNEALQRLIGLTCIYLLFLHGKLLPEW